MKDKELRKIVAILCDMKGLNIHEDIDGTLTIAQKPEEQSTKEMMGVMEKIMRNSNII